MYVRKKLHTGPGLGGGGGGSGGSGGGGGDRVQRKLRAK